MAWTHKNIEEIKVIVNIIDDRGEKTTYSEDGLMKDQENFRKLLKEMQQECIQLALQNHQCKNNHSK